MKKKKSVVPLVIVALALLMGGAALSKAIPAWQKMREENRKRQQTYAQCRSVANDILKEAKATKPEPGIYTAKLDTIDAWGRELYSDLTVEELKNSVVVVSFGPDENTNSDDIQVYDDDFQLRKAVLQGIEQGAHSAGKGVVRGAVEAVDELKDASVEKTKAVAAKVKTRLMDRFKKKEESDESND